MSASFLYSLYKKIMLARWRGEGLSADQTVSIWSLRSRVLQWTINKVGPPLPPPPLPPSLHQAYTASSWLCTISQIIALEKWPLPSFLASLVESVRDFCRLWHGLANPVESVSDPCRPWTWLASSVESVSGPFRPWPGFASPVKSVSDPCVLGLAWLLQLNLWPTPAVLGPAWLVQ